MAAGEGLTDEELTPTAEGIADQSLNADIKNLLKWGVPGERPK